MSQPLNLFPQRVPIGTVSNGNSVHMTPEFYRALSALFQRVGGSSSEVTLSGFLGETMGSMAVYNDAVVLAHEVVLAQPKAERQAPVDLMQAMPTHPVPETLICQPAATDTTPLPFHPLTPTESPMIIRADRRCAVHVTGSTSLIYGRSNKYLNVTANLIELNTGDTLTIEYSATPSITFIPR